MSQIDLFLEPGSEAPSTARRALGELQGVVGRERFEDVRLLTTELVTNSVRHASPGPGDRIRLGVAVSVETVRVRVDDHGPGFERPPSLDGRGSPDRRSTGGRGLYLVEMLADRWGVVREEGTGVWFEVDLPV